MGVTPVTLAVTVNAPTELPARTTVTTLPRLSDVWVVGFTVAAATGATAHDTWAPRSGKPSALSTVKPTDSVPPVSTESLSPKMPVIEPALGPVESPPQAREIGRASCRERGGVGEADRSRAETKCGT